MKPKISIIVPVYNVEPYLEDCVQSILSQSFTNFELILVNDGSEDKSGDLCNELENKDQRVKVIHKKYGGVSSARNAGLEMAKGEYIGFVDGDDRIHENMYLNLFKICEDTDSDISICKLGREINGVLINKDQELFVIEMDHLESISQLFKGELYRFSLCNKLFKRKCFKNICFPEGRIHEDLATTYKLFANSQKAVFTNYIGYIYVKRENSILTSRFKKNRLDSFIAWDEILAFIRANYLQMYNEILSSFVFWTVDNIHYILNQVETKEDRLIYLENIQKKVRKYYKAIINTESVKLYNKFLLSVFCFSIRSLPSLNYLKSLIRTIKSIIAAEGMKI